MGTTGPKQEIPKATGWEIPGALTKHVVLDPGIAYTTADVLMFAGTNPVGLGAMLTATGIAATLKTAAVLQPTWLDKHPRVKKAIFDDRTPLRAGGLALLVVTGATVATGAWLPAAASLLFAVANFRLAESISKKHIADEKDKKPAEPKKGFAKAVDIVTTIFKRPDIYLNAGFALAGLMAGGAALFILPVVAVAFALGVKNSIQGKPEYNAHPKLITAGAAGVFAGIGQANGHGLIAGAHLLNAVVLAEMERRITPGGAKQIFKNIVTAPLKLFGFGKKPEVVAAPVPVPVTVTNAATPVAKTSVQVATNNNERIPGPEVAPADLDKVDLQQVFAMKAKIVPPAPANENQQPAAEAINPPEHGNRPPKIAAP
ncbi:MAG TPA: hypothetical protein VEF76_07175 [Patescibacteria group bacterium]|nr:hypothetical protein [Patescibacteria group bacterium]